MSSIPFGIWLFMGITGGLFAAKAIYGFSIALVLPATRGALYVSTARRRVHACLDAVDLQPEQRLVDLGCGDGRVLRAACRRAPVRAEGYELNPLAYLKARLLNLGHPHARAHLKNFWRVDLSNADVVFCYLFPDVMNRLSRKLQRELRPGTTVVSCNFPLPGLAPVRVLRPGNSLTNDPIYVYRMPANLADPG